MKKLMNITTSQFDVPRYRDNADLKQAYRRFGLDGVEVMEGSEKSQNIILKDDVVGVHLTFFPCWVRLWRGDEEAILEEYGSWEVCRQVYGGDSGEALLGAYEKNLAFANELSPEYLVFHVSDSSTKESVTRRYRYTDDEVIDASIELINRITPGIQGEPLLLFENLWWPGLRLTRPETTLRFLQGVDYKNKGIMLDTGHLLHTNTALGTLDEALAYIHGTLDRYDDISFIKGIHLHQSLSGEYVERILKDPFPVAEDYFERFGNIHLHIYQIDRHEPFLHPGVGDLVRRIDPRYLVLEQISNNREEHEENLGRQMDYLRSFC
jgi:sugar phosphate isomerase/epimerase